MVVIVKMGTKRELEKKKKYLLFYPKKVTKVYSVSLFWPNQIRTPVLSRYPGPPLLT